MTRQTLSILLVLCASLVAACAVVQPWNAAKQAPFNEVAIIVWDAKNGTEDFIRSAQFSGGRDDLGFVVPTPTKPELTESDTRIYNKLYSLTHPKRELSGITLDGFFGDGSKGREVAKKGSHLAYNMYAVGGYEAVVIKADDATLLSEWLKKNKFEWNETLAQWAKDYVDKGWYLTAFRVSGNILAPVRMRFKTQQPFYPYKEPAGADPGRRRTLRIFFFGPERVDAISQGSNSEWRPVFAGSAESEPQIVSTLELKEHNAYRVTEFEDWTTSRDGVGDLTFAKGKKQGDVERYEETLDHRVHIPFLVWVPGAVALTWLGTRMYSRRNARFRQRAASR